MKAIRASIDIGSNSILLLAGDFSNGYKELLNESNVTGLGRDLDKNKAFLDIAMEESLEVLKNYSQMVQKIGINPEDVIVTATEAARVAQNAKAFIQEVKDQTGLKIQIITGAGEAYFSTKGILFNTSFKEDRIGIMDIGGASTELISVNPQTMEILTDFSMPFGAVRCTNWTEEGTVEEKLLEIKSDFSEKLKKIKSEKLYCVAGTMTSVANMYLGHKEFQEKKIHGLGFSTQEVFSMVDKYKNYSTDDYLAQFPFLDKRAKTINGGLKVATTVFNWLNIKEVEISTYGLRYGTLEQGSIPDEFIA
jgi:exopolyphosphatase/guanosine-5'-triphosphate,3'-diphosphate pyrophosphatase